MKSTFYNCRTICESASYKSILCQSEIHIVFLLRVVSILILSSETAVCTFKVLFLQIPPRRSWMLNDFLNGLNSFSAFEKKLCPSISAVLYSVYFLLYRKIGFLSQPYWTLSLKAYLKVKLHLICLECFKVHFLFLLHFIWCVKWLSVVLVFTESVCDCSLIFSMLCQ